MESKEKRSLVNWINNIDAHHRLYIALVVATIVYCIFKNKLSFPIHLMITWLTYTMVNLLFSWFTILTSHPKEVRKNAYNQDSSRTLVFIFVIVAAFASLFAVVVLLRSKGSAYSLNLASHVLISIISVLASWWLVHTIFTLRYAHFYYSDMDLNRQGKPEEPGGLDFPGEKEPDYIDFTYFSFVIGTTFQVSDVQITSKKIRRLVLIHSIISFLFNTIIVALSINIVSGIIN